MQPLHAAIFLAMAELKQVSLCSFGLSKKLSPRRSYTKEPDHSEGRVIVYAIELRFSLFATLTLWPTFFEISSNLFFHLFPTPWRFFCASICIPFDKRSGFLIKYSCNCLCAHRSLDCDHLSIPPISRSILLPLSSYPLPLKNF